ncbi:MAG TPA: ATP-binding cassette domain-containing protein [Desulfobacterales bacterium]|nr:ATP-binding cassette domain-containing protein [Desulfobacterales bacterium]
MDSRVFLEVKDLTKTYPGVVANDQVSLSLEKGKMYALVGENGAGKSTLLKTIFGLNQPNSGEIILNGNLVRGNSPQKAIANGIGFVTQDLSLIPTFNPIENTAIQMDFSKGILLNLTESARKLKAKSVDLGFQIDFGKKTIQTPLEDCQKIEILRRLATSVRLLILDEPSSMLTPLEEAQMLASIRTLVDDCGLTVLFTTHKFENLLKYPHELIVMRKGRIVLSEQVETLCMKAIINAVTGEELREKSQAVAVVGKREPLLTIDNLTSEDDAGRLGLRNIDLHVHPGEIVGIVGTAFSGKDSLAKVILGISKVTEGSITFDSENITNQKTRHVLNKGISYIPKDLTVALAYDLSVAENLVLNRFYDEPFCRNFFLDIAAIEEAAERSVEKFNIITRSIHTPVSSLSGGNQRKVVVAREIGKDSKLLIAEDPTIGIDINTAQEVLNYLIEFRNRGCGVLLMSEDLDELMSIADVIHVLYEKEIVKTIPGAEATLETLGKYMLGWISDGKAFEV